MNSNKKPRTALAKLLDSMREIDQPSGSSVTIPDTMSKKTEQFEQRTPELTKHNEANNLKFELLDPNDCQPWKFADRPEDEMGDIEQLSQSLKIVGQQEPVLARLKQDTTEIRYEIIFGNRRWRAAKLAKIKLLAIVKEVSDQDAALYQTEENEARKDLSDLARAKSYKAQLDSGVFVTEAELSKKLLISRKTLNDIMAFIRVPEELAIAIPNYKHLSRAMVVKLAMLAKDKTLLKKLISISDKIGTKAINTSNINKYLEQNKPIQMSRSEQEFVKDKDGNILFIMSINAKGQTIIKLQTPIKKHNTSILKKMIYEHLTNK